MIKKSPFTIALVATSLAVGAPIGAAVARDGAPTPERDAESPPFSDNFIEIPGVGPIPIPLPPGGRIFGPHAAPQARPAQPRDKEQPERRSPAISQPRGNGLDELFARLGAASDDEEARAIGNLIRRSWARSGSDTADLLTDRAHLAESLGEHMLAMELFDHVLALQPRWSEAFVQRAQVRAGFGDIDGALADFEIAVRLEPRRFDAFAALGALEEQKGDKKRALEAYRRSLAIDPKQEELVKAQEKLRLEVEGRDI
jgi:tetratricopeptide (TPR) repeat protein